MRLKQKLGIAVTGIFLGGATVVMCAEKSIAITVLLSQTEHQSPTVINSNPRLFTPFQLALLTLSNVEIANKELTSCWIQQPLPLTNAVELLMRLLVVGSFGSVSIAGSSSLMQRYINVINREFVLIVRCVILLLCILVMSSMGILLFSSTYPSSYSACPKPKFFLVNLHKSTLPGERSLFR